MNNIQLIRIPLLLLLGGLAACRPDPMPTPVPEPEPIQLADYIHAGNPLFFENDSCQDFLMSNCGNLSGCQEFWDDWVTLPGSFNPTNPRELAFTLAKPASGWGKLYVVNLESGARNMIHEKISTRSRVDWSSDGWLLFDRGIDGIWKAHSNGDSLTQLVVKSGPGAIGVEYPKWGQEGNFYASNPGAYGFRFEASGKIIDTLPRLGGYLTASPDDRYWVTHQAGAGYCLYDWQRDSLLPVFWPVEPWDFYSTPAWTPDGQEIVFIVWRLGDPAYQFIRVNPWTGAQTVIREVRCVNRFYNHPRISPDGKWIYTLMWWIEDLGDAKRYRDFYISFMRIDGSEEFLAEFEG